MDQVCHRLVLAQIRPSFRPGAPKIISTLRPPSVIVPTGRTRKKSYSLLSRGARWAEYRPTRSMKRNPWFPRSPSGTRPPFGDCVDDCWWEGLSTAIGNPLATTEELFLEPPFGTMHPASEPPATPIQDGRPVGKACSLL